MVLQKSCSQPELTIFHLGGDFSSCRRTQRYSDIYSLSRNQDAALKLHYCFLTAPPCLCSCALPGLDGCLNLLFETQGRGHRQASVLRSPMGSCLVSFSLFWLPLRREEFPLFSHICNIIPLIFQWSWLL